MRTYLLDCIMPHLQYCLLVRAYYSSEQNQIDKVILQAKHIITGTKSSSVDKVNFKLSRLTCFTYLMFGYITSQ